MRRTLNLISLCAASGISLGSDAQAQRELPHYNELPCNALCRAYMGSYYSPPADDAAPEHPANAEATAPLAPPRPAGLKNSRVRARSAAVPPVRPHDLTPGAIGSGELQLVLPPPAPPDIEIPVALGPDLSLILAAPSAQMPLSDVQVELPPEVATVALDAEASSADHENSAEE